MKTTYSKKIFSVLCTMLMIAMIFQNVSAEYNSGEDMDIFVDSYGNDHLVWRELVNNTTYQVFYGFEITNTVYSGNDETYFNETIEGNIFFEDGNLTIQDCQINGNIMVSRANVLIDNCVVNGNIKHLLRPLSVA